MGAQDDQGSAGDEQVCPPIAAESSVSAKIERTSAGGDVAAPARKGWRKGKRWPCLAGMAVLCLALLFLASCLTAQPGPTETSTVLELVDVVRQTDGVRQAGNPSPGFVYLIEDGRSVRAWEYSEGQLMEIAPDVADVKLDAVDGGCLPDGSIESGMTRVIRITSPTEAEAVFAILTPYGYYSQDLKLAKVDDRWQVISERETRLDLLNQCEPAK